ncbi:MAG: sigma-70 family RNA polymerase sigma factor [Candidatus Aminicenantes bacterium]|nr:sigma-70 family RNA polymerase sigma factor [Candidatus Aminicenantes bacterium]
MEDCEIITKCLSGQMEAFELLVKKYQSGLLSLAWHVLGDKEEARDITQEAFIQSYKNLDRFDMEKSFKNWITAIAYRRCLDRIKKQKVRNRHFRSARFEDCVYFPHNGNERLEDSDLFQTHLNKLNPNERMTLSLKINHGYSSKEIAEVLNSSESTVRVYIFNAKRKLKKLLKERENVQAL